MKINIISFNNSHSLSVDCTVISNCLKKFYRNRKIIFQFYNFQEVNASIADINIFVGLVSNTFFKYAPINILIIDPHKFDSTWFPYLYKFDKILCKTSFGQDLLRSRIKNIDVIGWKSPDRYENIEKDFSSFLCVVGVSVYRQLKDILNLWKEDYPKLTILCGKNYLNNHQIEKKKQDNIEYIEEYLPEGKFNRLLSEKGIHLCLSSASAYGNTIHNARSVKSVPIVMDNVLNRSFISNNVSGFSIKTRKKKKLKNSFGSEYLLDPEDFTNVIEKVIKLDELMLEEIGEYSKKDYLQQTREFEKKFKELFDDIWTLHKKVESPEEFYKIFDEDLPNVSIITPTYNRRQFFKLAIRNFQKADYPSDKLEWIIIDDSETDSVQDLLPNNKNINYIRLNERHSIGEKRNIGVKNAKNEIIVCMDDDDYYQPGSIKYRVACLQHLNKQVVGCTSMGVLDINKIISNMSVSSFITEFQLRAFESSFAFRKSHALKHKFLDTNIHEGQNLIKDNLEHYEEIIYNPIMVSLIHYNNTNKRIKVKGETNGCHFNFSDDLFNLITNLDHQDEDINKLDLNKVIKKEEPKEKN